MESEDQEPQSKGLVRVIEQQRLLDDFFKVDCYTISYRRSDGTWSQPLRRLVFERGDAVAVLPYNPETGELLLVRQLRVPTLVRGGEGWLWELIAGVWEPDRSPEEVACTEALEEAGYRFYVISPLLSFYPSPGGSSERIMVFLADLRRAERIASGGGVPSSGEDIQVGRFTLSEALEMIRRGAIVDAKTIIALQYVALWGANFGD